METEFVPLMEGDKVENEQPESRPPQYVLPQPVPNEYRYSSSPQPAAQSSNNNTVVVGSQPACLPRVSVTEPALKPSQTTLVLSLGLLAVCSAVCYFPALFCLIPGVIFAVVGFNFKHSSDRKQSAGGFNGVSLCCSITAIVSFAATMVCILLYISLAFGIGNSGYHSCSCNNYCDIESYVCSSCSC